MNEEILQLIYKKSPSLRVKRIHHHFGPGPLLIDFYYNGYHQWVAYVAEDYDTIRITSPSVPWDTVTIYG